MNEITPLPSHPGGPDYGPSSQSETASAPETAAPTLPHNIEAEQ